MNKIFWPLSPPPTSQEFFLAYLVCFEVLACIVVVWFCYIFFSSVCVVFSPENGGGGKAPLAPPGSAPVACVSDLPFADCEYHAVITGSWKYPNRLMWCSEVNDWNAWTVTGPEYGIVFNSILCILFRWQAQSTLHAQSMLQVDRLH